MVIQYDSNRTVLRVVSIQVFQQSDKLTAAMAPFNSSGDMARMQIKSGEDRARTQTLVFIIPADGSVFTGHGRQVGSGVRNGLQSWFLIDRNGDYPGVVIRLNPALILQFDVLVDHQYFSHLADKVWIATLQIIGHLIWPESLPLQNPVHGCLRRSGQTRMPFRLGVLSNVPGQSLPTPHF